MPSQYTRLPLSPTSKPSPTLWSSGSEHDRDDDPSNGIYEGNGAEDDNFITQPETRPIDYSNLSHEYKILAQLTVPVTITSIMRNCIGASTILAVAKLGTVELAAASLGLLTSNITGTALIIGIAGALDTLANQASRSSSPKLTSLYALRVFVVMTCIYPLIVILQWKSKAILHMITPHADPDVLHLSAQFIRVMTPGIPAIAIFECVRRYLASLCLLAGPTVIYCAGAPLSAFLSWLFVHSDTRFNMGFVGAPVACIAVYWLSAILIVIYAYFKAPRNTWCGLSREIFRDLAIVVKYGAASTASTCSEWFAFECIQLGSSYLGPVSQAAASIILTTMGFLWSIPSAIGTAVAIRVGNLLGQGLPNKARVSSTAMQHAVFGVMTIECVVLFIFRRSLGHLFSDDKEVVDLVDSTMWLVVSLAYFDGVQGATTGVLKGCGQQTIAANANLFSYWMLGLPIGAFLTYKIHNIEGLLAGMTLAVVTTSSIMLWIIWKNNWQKLSDEALMRIAVSDTNAHLSNIEDPHAV